MLDLRPAGEPEVVLAFLRGELDSLPVSDTACAEHCSMPAAFSLCKALTLAPNRKSGTRTCPRRGQRLAEFRNVRRFPRRGGLVPRIKQWGCF